MPSAGWRRISGIEGIFGKILFLKVFFIRR
jgi:hypothetical protein